MFHPFWVGFPYEYQLPALGMTVPRQKRLVPPSDLVGFGDRLKLLLGTGLLVHVLSGNFGGFLGTAKRRRDAVENMEGGKSLAKRYSKFRGVHVYVYVYVYDICINIYIYTHHGCICIHCLHFCTDPCKKISSILVNPKSLFSPGDISGKPSCWMILTRQLTEGSLQVPEGKGVAKRCFSKGLRSWSGEKVIKKYFRKVFILPCWFLLVAFGLLRGCCFRFVLVFLLLGPCILKEYPPPQEV